MSGNLRRLGFTGANLPEWHAEGACAARSDLDWYAETPGKVRAVKAVCAGCPVRVACLQWAIDRREAWGIWGALDPKERAKYAEEVGAGGLTISEHGTRARYTGTKSTPGCRCDPCRRAHADYEHARRVVAEARKAAGWVAPQQPCGLCSTMFTPRQARHRYCSRDCAQSACKAAEKRRRQARQRNKRCAQCRKVRPAGKKRFCSAECVRAADRARAAEKRAAEKGWSPLCRQCGTERPADRHTYCSDFCRRLAAKERRIRKRVLAAERGRERLDTAA